jgi:hypothetical protein
MTLSAAVRQCMLGFDRPAAGTENRRLRRATEEGDVMKAPDASHNAAMDLPESTRPGFGSWFILAVLVLLLLATVWVVYIARTSVGNGAVPTSGYVAMALGVGFFAGRRIWSNDARVLQQPKRLRRTAVSAMKAARK